MDKSISLLPMHYAYGTLRYLMKALSLPERFSIRNKALVNSWDATQMDIAFANS